MSVVYRYICPKKISRAAIARHPTPKSSFELHFHHKKFAFETQKQQTVNEIKSKLNSISESGLADNRIKFYCIISQPDSCINIWIDEVFMNINKVFAHPKAESNQNIVFSGADTHQKTLEPRESSIQKLESPIKRDKWTKCSCRFLYRVQVEFCCVVVGGLKNFIVSHFLLCPAKKNFSRFAASNKSPKMQSHCFANESIRNVMALWFNNRLID